VNTVKNQQVPILIRCAAKDAAGSVNGAHVRVVPKDWATLVSTSFDRDGGLAEIERKRLRGVLQLFDAVRNNKRQKHEDVARGIAKLEADDSIFTGMMRDPMTFLSTRVSARCSRAMLVLWKQRNGTLSAGILCKDMVEAFYALVLFYIVCGRISRTGECVICGTIFDRKRGVRRKTCSDACRKRASLAGLIKAREIGVKKTI
jgi:hypothetical protein